VVIGAGLAGLVAALRLAEEGRRVAVVAKGAGSLQLGGSTIDVAGYAPERTASPREGIEALAAGGEHPYARVGAAAVEAAAAWLLGRDDVPPLTGTLDDHLLLPTAVGAVKPTAYAPPSLAAGDLRRPEPVAVVGFDRLKDFYPAFCSENLRRAHVEARPLVIDPDVSGEADPGGLRFAQAFEDPEFRRSLVRDLQGKLDAEERVGFPAVLGLSHHHTVWRELEEALERPVFEIPTLPPSIPGMRLARALTTAVRGHGARVVIGPPVTGAERRNGTVVAVTTETSTVRPGRYEAPWFVLASGGVSAGGIELGSTGELYETILGLPLAGVPAPGAPRFAEHYLDEQPLARAGVAVDETLRPLDAAGERALHNVVVAGATLAGAVPWREASGNGISLATGHAAAQTILDAEAA
jgi:glycerol-3-phosphate dehydrogenase subunit B